jgi:hypothetical protein
MDWMLATVMSFGSLTKPSYLPIRVGVFGASRSPTSWAVMIRA